MVTPQLPRHPVLAFLRHSTLYAHTVSQFMCMYLLAGRVVSVGFTNNDIHIALLHQEIKNPTIFNKICWVAALQIYSM